MRKTGKISLALLAAASLLSSCISNNLPHPYVRAVLDVEVEGAIDVKIDYAENIIRVELEETTDICNVRITKADISSNDKNVTSIRTDRPMTGTFDLSEPQTFTFTNMFQDEGYDSYKWQIVASQTIEHYFSVEGQIGATVIDEVNHRIIVTVPKKMKLSGIHVKSMKLGPEGITTYSKGLDEVWNLLDGTSVDATAHGRTQRWEVYAEKSLLNVSWKDIAGWSRCAWLRANGIEGQECGFFYREAGSEDEWTEISGENIIHDGGLFTACADGLLPEHSYECYAYCGADVTPVEQFSTEAEMEIPNGAMDVFSNAESNKYFSFFDPAHALWNKKWWDTGNVGSTAVGEAGIISFPDKADKAPQPEGNVASAHLTSKYVVVKFAAGNIFTGEFAGLVGTKGGKVNFGRPWTARPRKLVFDVKAKIGVINHKDDDIIPLPGVEINKDMDPAEIFVCLGDWDYRKYGGTAESPVQVNTTIESTLFNPHSEGVIAYGVYNALDEDEKVRGEWHHKEVSIEYYDYFRKPTHIVISCAASKYGDFFTGCDTNELQIDNMRFEY